MPIDINKRMEAMLKDAKKDKDTLKTAMIEMNNAKREIPENYKRAAVNIEKKIQEINTWLRDGKNNDVTNIVDKYEGI